ncbi:MAG: nucleotidyltransferase domain-containing protein [Deferribacteraceae bacterium]|jgi:predicted nucleotidyltransferase|nr:nucleotidyltransferase domain-containing protein [Deferribacteraceae bacterium]
MLIDIFNKHCPNAEIWAYGSRVNGDAHKGSDLDLAIKELGESNIDAYELKEIIRESNIPFLVDIHEFNNLPDSFQREILRKYLTIYPQSTPTVLP